MSCVLTFYEGGGAFYVLVRVIALPCKVMILLIVWSCIFNVSSSNMCSICCL
jgi:hypothetical protein